MDRELWDVIVVGAGVSGATAAREAAAGGASVLVVEARDRIGGRTYSTVRNGYEVELGGAYVHWWQAQSFSEVQRYGFELDRVPWLADTAYLPSPSGPRRGDTETLRSALLPLLEAFSADAEEILPLPFDPLLGPRVAEYDQLSVESRIESMQLDPTRRMILSGMLSAMCSGPLAEVGLVPALRWFAVHRWDGVQFMDREHFRIRGGVTQLTEAILGDAACEVRLRTPVARVEQDEAGIALTTRDGDELRARSAVFAVPLATLAGIGLPDDAPPAWHRLAAESVGSRGLKVGLRATPESPSVVAIGPPEAPITWLVTDARADDGSTMLTGFGPDGDRLDGKDLAAVRAAVAAIAPEVEVVETFAHDWLGDEYCRGTWGLLRPGQLTGALADLQKPWGRVALAGADTGSCWGTFIAGGIEAGVRAGRQARDIVGR